MNSYVVTEDFNKNLERTYGVEGYTVRTIDGEDWYYIETTSFAQQLIIRKKSEIKTLIIDGRPLIQNAA